MPTDTSNPTVRLARSSSRFHNVCITSTGLHAEGGIITSLPVKSVLVLAPAVLIATLLLFGSGIRNDSSPDLPHFNADNQLLPPEHYREWVFLTAGFGMTYNPSTASSSDAPFDNVFVNPPAYKTFQETGSWPDGTIFVLEIRSSASKGSINEGGHFQRQDVRAVEVHVRDEHRFPGKWAFFEVRGKNPSSAVPRDASCYSCHSAHGAVDTTFVQFYPTLIETAKAKGTYKAPE